MEYPSGAANWGPRLAARVGGDLESRVQGELLHDVAHVALDGMSRDVESLRNLLVAEPFANELDDLELPRRHSHILEHILGLAPSRLLRDVRDERVRHRR